MPSTPSNDTAMHQHPAELLQQLIRFDTTNPPGNERACITYINNILTEAGFETTILSSDARRPNLVTRLKGAGHAPPLLLQGHIDVVTTEKQQWQHPPFEARQVDDYIWGRGTLDMKGGVAMMLAALLRAQADAASLPGDVIFTALSDEEAGGTLGAQFLVEQHPSLFKNVRYALGEFGGFTFHVGGKKFYLIQVLEKHVCWLKATTHGLGGHGSLPVRGGAVAKLGHCIQQLDQHRLPVHIHPVTRQLFEEMAQTVPAPLGPQLQQLLDPDKTDAVLDSLDIAQRRLFEPILHNTVNITILEGSSKINVIPGEVVFELDGRLLPGYTPDDMLHELRQVVGDEVSFEVVRYGKGEDEANMGLFDTLKTVLHEADPTGIPIPFLMPVVTDGRFFSQLGIQTYGFLPIDLPPDFNFLQTVHAADERIPVASMEFGTQAIYEVLQRNHS